MEMSRRQTFQSGEGLDIRIYIWEKIAELRDQMQSLRRYVRDVRESDRDRAFKVCILDPVLVERGEKVEKKKKPEE